MGSRSFRNRKIKLQIWLFFPVVLLILSLIFIGIGKFQNKFLREFQMALRETVAPIGYVVSSPVRWLKNGYDFSVDFVRTYRDNKKLIDENNTLKEWKNLALKLQSEQDELHRLLNYTPPPKTTFITADVIADNGGYFEKSLLVMAGQKDGVKKGDVAMTPNGVYGRVVEVGHTMSRLMLLTDHSSRVPVIVGKGKIFAILSGDNSAYPKLINLPEDAPVSVGDVVLTSGQVGVYPAGLPVGIIKQINNGEISVSLFENAETPLFVKLVDFKLSSVLLALQCKGDEK